VLKKLQRAASDFLADSGYLPVIAADGFPVVGFAGVNIDQLRLGQPADRIALVDDDGERINRNHFILQYGFFVILEVARYHADLAFPGTRILDACPAAPAGKLDRFAALPGVKRNQFFDHRLNRAGA